MPDRRTARLWTGAAVAACLVGAPLWAVPADALDRLSAARNALISGDAILAEAEAKAAMKAGAARRDVAAVMGEALLNQGRPDRALDWVQSGDFSPADAAYGWRILGRVEMARGNLGGAARAFDRALQLNSRDAQLWVDIGRLRHAGGEDLLVLDAAERALGANPKHPRALELRAELSRDTAGYAPSIAYYQQALQNAPSDPGIALGLASTLGDAGQAEALLAVLRDGQNRAAGTPRAFYYQAVLAARAGDLDTARRVFNQTYGKLPAVNAVKLFSGVLELEAGNPSVASTALDELVRAQPDNTLAQLLLARALYESGEHDRLIATFGPTAARPDAPAYLLTLIGRSYEERGDREAAAPFLDRASRAGARTISVLAPADGAGSLAAPFAANPGNRRTAVGYVRALLDGGNAGSARAAADRFRQARPHMSEAFGLWGDVAVIERRYDQAFAAYNGAAQARFSENLLYRMTVALEGMGRTSQAQGVAARYLAAYPTSAAAARLSAGYAAGLGRWDQAFALLTSLVARGGTRDVQLLADLSFAQLQSGDAQAAFDTARQASALQPANPQAAQALALALVALKQDDAAARAALDKAQAIGGDNPLIAQARSALAKRQAG